MAVQVIFLTSGTSWVVPSDCALISRIDCIGPGASGVAGSSGGDAGSAFPGAAGGAGGAGGGGGAWSLKNNLSVTPGSSITYQVGTPGSSTWFQSTGTVLAAPASGSTGGQSGSGVGDSKFSGGNGSAGQSGSPGSGGTPGGNGGYGGGGGGAAGPNAAGGAGGITGGGNGNGGTNGGGSGSGTGTAGNSSTTFQSNPGGSFAGPGGAGGGGNYGTAGTSGVGAGAGGTGGDGGLYGAGGAGGGGGGGGAAFTSGSASGGSSGAGRNGIIIITYDPVPQYTPNSSVWADAIRRAPPFHAARQQFSAFIQYEFEENRPADRWFVPFSEPTRYKPRLATSLQQFASFVQAEPFEETTIVSKWFVPFSEPIRFKTALRPMHTGAQQFDSFVQAAPFEETVRSDKWFVQFSEPIRLKPRLETALQWFGRGIEFPLTHVVRERSITFVGTADLSGVPTSNYKIVLSETRRRLIYTAEISPWTLSG